MKTIEFDGIVLELHDEVTTSRRPAAIVIRTPRGAKTIDAIIEHRQGADGGYYPVVEFRE